MPKTPVRLLCAFAAVTGAGAALAQVSEEEELAMAYGDKSFVTIATGSRVATTRAPAVASVITAEDIKALGATDLDQVLETVPGLHVARSSVGYSPVYVMRGIFRSENPQVLMLVNGIPMTMSFQGNRGDVWAGLPLENVARIEVIRGPGSAVYGSDAFAGVINIITKTAADIDGTQFGVRAGSFNTRDAWALHGGKLGDIDVAAYLRVGDTDGADSWISADAVGKSGPMNTARNAMDGSLDLAYGKWRFRAGYKERKDVGHAAGVALALDPTGHSSSERITSDLTYQDANFAQDWDVNLQASYINYKEFTNAVLFPAGTSLWPGNTFVDGMIGNPHKWEQHGRINASAFYTGFEQHRVRLGMGVNSDELYKVQESKNFGPTTTPCATGLVPGLTRIGTGSLADVTDVSDTCPFMHPESRQVRYMFAQDEWNFAKDWTLTAGLRRDMYSDFGGTTNPRLALVWEAAYDLTAKLMYGTAFRAPSFTELYSINNPVQIGSASLQPERMKTFEAAVSWQPAARLKLGFNLFRYQMSNIIQLNAANTYENGGEQTGTGYELEAAWDATREVRLSGNFSHQRSIDEATQQDAGNAPHDRLYLRADWRFATGWAANAQINAVGKRLRAPGDTRAPLAGYTTVDLTLRTDKGPHAWDFAVSARNLFNTDAREPAPAALPNDFPLPGRSVWVQAEYKL